jgi:hypothetical protein
VRQAPIFIIALTLAAGAGSQACNRGERAHGGPEATTDATTPTAGTTSASAERQIITLTGCLKRDVQPGTYALISVATAGVIDDGKSSQAQQQERDTKGQDAATQNGRAPAADTATPDSAASLASGSSYRLIPAKDDQRQDMARYENQRVAVRGRLAADTPVGTSGSAGDSGSTGAAASGGTVVDSSATNTTVAGSASTLRGLQVESVRKVGDSCQ